MLRKEQEHGPVVARTTIHADGAQFLSITARISDVNIPKLLQEAVAKAEEQAKYGRTKRVSQSVTSQ